MIILKTPQEFKKWRLAQGSKTVGFVPTMGALHQGHGQLLKTARPENDLLVLSIYVNQTQFNDPNDFQKYPITWEADLALAKSMGVDAVFAPEYQDMYPDNYKYKVIETEFSGMLCGAHRPGHFDGVLSVVMKLFNIVSPTRAYFGEKDFQQLSLLRGIVEAFFMNLEIIPVPTVRESDGLAMSSRNVRLTPEEREKAPQIYKIITNSPTEDVAKANLVKEGFDVDYVVDYKGRRFVAVKLGAVRLIDNVSI